MVQSVILGVTKQNAGVYIEETQIQVNLPLRQPVGSVLTAVRQIGFTSRNQTVSQSDWCVQYQSNSTCNLDPSYNI